MTQYVLRIVGSALGDITEHDDRFVMRFDADKPTPLRPDRKPNRPLTAFTVELVRI